jgi:O-antigen polysaccharide polymerase Wzy
MRVALMGTYTFSLSRNDQGIVLFCITLSAFCVYAACRWNYRQISSPDEGVVRPYLPYLYLVFFASLPVQAFKNYRYYEYAQQHGGYFYIYLNHAGLASSVPFVVRFVSLITFPVFVALFVFEKRKKYLYLVTGLYVATASFILLLGQRSTVFALAIALWYVAQVKSGRKPRLLRVTMFVAVLALAATLIQVVRENPDQPIDMSDITSAPADFLVMQGASLGVTQVAVAYRGLFAPFGPAYLGDELRDAFVASDASSYYRGKLFPFDVSSLRSKPCI